MTAPRPSSPFWALLAVTAILVAACAGPATPGAPTIPGAPTASAPGAGAGTDSVVVGPLTLEPPIIDPATDLGQLLVVAEGEDRAAGRTQAGFAREVGSGWAALSASVDAATDAAVQAVADELAIEIPTSHTARQFASVNMPRGSDSLASASAASALAIVTASLTTGKALGQGGTKEVSNTQTNTTTGGDDSATVVVKMTGTITSTGSRVVGVFTFELTGNVVNHASGATAQMHGTATARVEIDGCPDSSGSSKGKLSLSSSESVSGQHDGGEGTASWRRDLTADFDIKVNDAASISGMTVDAQASESVVETEREPGDDEPETDGHELAGTMHAEYTSGPGFAGMTHDRSRADGDVTHQENATKAHLAGLVKSAFYAIGVATFGLGTDAESFWRDGKCIEVVVDPKGGDVEANSTTSVVATLKQRFDGSELDKPVTATLIGVTALDPAGEPQPAPATFTYTAGPDVGNKGEVKFESISNRGIGRTTVTFTVKPGAWTTNADTPLGEIRGLKCSGVGGEWTVEGVEHLGILTITTLWSITIDGETLSGTYRHHKLQLAPGSETTSDAQGSAHIVINADGSVIMTLDPAPITLTTTAAGIGSATAIVPGDGRMFLWATAPSDACP